MPDTPLNPDAIHAVMASFFPHHVGIGPNAGRLSESVARGAREHVENIVSAYLAVAQQEVNTFEDSDALPVGSVVLDVDGNTARRFPDGWRTTVVEADGRVWLSGHMEDPDLPARVLHRPEVNDA